MVAFDFVIEERKIPIYGYNNFVPKRIITGQKAIQGSFAINFTRSYDMHYILENVAESLYATEYEEAQFFCADDNKALFDKGFDITISYGDDRDDSGFKSYNSCTQTLVGCHITSYRQAFDTSGEPILDMYTFIAKDLIVEYSSQPEPEEIDPSNDHSVSYLYNENDDDMAGIAENQYNINPDALHVSIWPLFTYADNKYKLTARTMIRNTNIKDIKITSLTFVIKGMSYILSPDNTGDYFTYVFKNNDWDKINKSIKDSGMGYIDFDIELKCQDADGKIYDPILYNNVSETKLYNDRGLLNK
jgi:hypothetical protein